MTDEATQRPPRRYLPGTEAWKRAWSHDPGAIARELTPDERHDPRRNPLHPYASASPAWIPGEPHKRTLPPGDTGQG